jgi:hypothetical protein
MSLAVRTQIKERIIELGRGSIFFPTDFYHLGSVSAVNMALSRLTKSEFILRLATGIYNYPRYDSLLGISRPSMEDIAFAVAKKEQIIIRPTGATALLKLGLSSQVPMKVVYLTNGNPRQIKVGKGQITFKKTSPKIMAIKGDITFLAVQAMLILDKNSVTDEVVKQLKGRLRNEDPQQMIEDAKLVPSWIRIILFKIRNEIVHND